jgi:hypothetical protein
VSVAGVPRHDPCPSPYSWPPLPERLHSASVRLANPRGGSAAVSLVAFEASSRSGSASGGSSYGEAQAFTPCWSSSRRKQKTRFWSGSPDGCVNRFLAGSTGESMTPHIRTWSGPGQPLDAVPNSVPQVWEGPVPRKKSICSSPRRSHLIGEGQLKFRAADRAGTRKAQAMRLGFRTPHIHTSLGLDMPPRGCT